MRYRRPLPRVTGPTAEIPANDVPELVSGDNFKRINYSPEIAHDLDSSSLAVSIFVYIIL